MCESIVHDWKYTDDPIVLYSESLNAYQTNIVSTVREITLAGIDDRLGKWPGWLFTRLMADSAFLSEVPRQLWTTGKQSLKQGLEPVVITSESDFRLCILYITAFNSFNAAGVIIDWPNTLVCTF